MSKFLNEFKEFAMRGNVLDMAVGVIIGGAFGKIVSSVVDDVIMPPIGWLIGGVNFADLKFTLPTVNVAGEELKAATINYGNFLQTCFDFLIVAFCIFRRSRISMRSFSSLLGSGALGVSAGFSSSFFLETLFTTLMSMKIQNATMRKSKQVCRKLP